MQGKPRFITLSSDESAALQLGWKTDKKSTFRHRCHYILLSSQGKSIAEISSFYGVTRQSISKWFTNYEQKGIEGLRTGKGQGRPAILRIDNEVEMNKLEELVEASPQSLKVVVAQLEEEFGKTVSIRTLHRLLKKKNGLGNDLEK
jgi:transposase